MKVRFEPIKGDPARAAIVAKRPIISPDQQTHQPFGKEEIAHPVQDCRVAPWPFRSGMNNFPPYP